MRKHFLVILLCLFASVAFSQKAVIRGQVFSDSAKNGVSDVTVSLKSVKDSTVEDITFTNDKGVFSFKNVNTGEYNLLFSALNYSPQLKFIRITSQSNTYLIDSIKLDYRIDTLQPVTVIGKKIPIVIRGDTTEFNAGSFKVVANALVEDLLRAIPGLQVERDGTVKAQGVTVTQVWVDGKPFFGGDPKTVTQNLPADIIDKVQLVEAKSDQAKYTNIDDGKREKVLNLTIKKDKKKGVFGTAYLGYGEAEHYEAKLNANYFDHDTKLAFVASGNNTSRTDYSGNDGFDIASYNSRNGITDDKQVKLNYNDKVGKGFDFYSGLSLNQNKNSREYLRNRQTFYADSSNWYYEGSGNRYDRKGMNVNLGFSYSPDTLTFINFNQTAGYYISKNESTSDFSSTLTGIKKVNEGTRENLSKNSSPTFNGQLSISRRLKKRGRTLYFNLMNNVNELHQTTSTYRTTSFILCMQQITSNYSISLVTVITGIQTLQPVSIIQSQSVRSHLLVSITGTPTVRIIL